MKKYNRSIVYLVVFLVGGLAFYSCIKEKDYEKNVSEVCSGVPTITGISVPSSALTTKDTLTQANLGDWVIIHGDNLCAATQVMFDDLSITLANAYITSTAITLQIPRKIPATITNKMKVVASAGSAERNFKLTFPDLVLSGFENEFTPVGDSLIILGDNFDLYEVTPASGKVKFGDTEVAVGSSTSSQVKVKVPVGANTNNIVLTLTSPSITKTAQIVFRKVAGSLLLDYNSSSGWWAGAGLVTDGTAAGDPKPINGKFTRLHATLGQWSWTTIIGTGFNLPDDDIAAHPQNYYFKFELNTTQPIPKYAAENGGIIWPNSEWRSLTGPTADTKKLWKTMTFEATKIFAAPKVGWNDFSFALKTDNAASSFDIDFSMCNFRFVHK
jgi:hypothetical protein